MAKRTARTDAPTAPPVEVVLYWFNAPNPFHVTEQRGVVTVPKEPKTPLFAHNGRHFEFTGHDAEGRRIYRDFTR